MASSAGAPGPEDKGVEGNQIESPVPPAILRGYVFSHIFLLINSMIDLVIEHMRKERMLPWN